MFGAERDLEGQSSIATFRQRLQELGWTKRRNLTAVAPTRRSWPLSRLM